MPVSEGQRERKRESHKGGEREREREREREKQGSPEAHILPEVGLKFTDMGLKLMNCEIMT